MALIDFETALSRNNSLQPAQPPSFEAVICISAVEKLSSSPAHQPAVPAHRPLLLAKLRRFVGQLLGALHESRRRRAAIILREQAIATALPAANAARTRSRCAGTLTAIVTRSMSLSRIIAKGSENQRALRRDQQ
jgi:hypothetical protein